MLDNLYRQVNEGVETLRGQLLLGFVALIECTVVPITIELFVAPLMATSRRPFLIAHVILIGTLAGALLGYWLGAVSFEPLIKPALEWAGWMDEFSAYEADLRANGFWAVFLVGLTPIPFQIGTVGAGLVGYSLPLFCVAVLASRAIRYYAVALLAWYLGRRAKAFLENYGTLVLFVGTAVLVLGYLVYEFVLL